MDIAVQDPLCIGIENCEVIRTVQELQAMLPTGDRHYILGNDIHASETETWNSGKGFEPIGNDNARFDGTFDGNGFQIVGLRINRPQEDDVGLFGIIASSATIHDVTIADWKVRGRKNTGTLAGVNYGDLIEIGLEGGDIGGEDHTGGLVGTNHGLIQNLTNESVGVTVKGVDRVGGVVGFSIGTIKDFQIPKGITVEGQKEVGGVAGAQGRAYHGITPTVTAVIRDGSVKIWRLKATADLGGIVGVNGTPSSIGIGGTLSFGTIADIYNVRVELGTTLSVTEGNAGGAVGAHMQGKIERVSVVSNHGAEGAISHVQATGPARLGGFAGFSSGTIHESFVLSSFALGAAVGLQSQQGTSIGGGFVGLLSGGTIEDAYVIANAAPQTTLSGGFAGQIGPSGTLQRVYAKMKNTGLGNPVQTAGGLVAKNDRNDAVAFSYWDKESSGLNTSAAGTGLTTTQMGRSISFSGWNFQNIWKITDGLPDLQNNPR